MTGKFVSGRAARTTKWLLLLTSATSLGGCMVSALETASIYPAEPVFGYAAPAPASLEVPQPIPDAPVGEPSSSGAMTDADGTPSGMPSPPVEIASETVTAASPMPDTGAPVPAGDLAQPIDPATARIYAAAGPATVAPQPGPLAGIARRTNGLLSMFSNRTASAPAREALAPPAPLSGANQAEMWSASNTGDTLPARTVTASASVLPGVDRDRALGVSQPETNAAPEASEPIRVASAAGLARLAPNGLKVQNGGVDVQCLKPALVQVLKKIERHYGREVVVTSGYRNPTRNKKVSGSENSLHMYCSAADIQIDGVGKWELASYLRSMPGRGGVGTYCHTDSVHIDIGPKRDWNWRCRGKK